VVAASDRVESAQLVQTLFRRPTSRVYPTGTISSALNWAAPSKMFIAIAAGVCDGLGFA
jgi:glycerol-3-phosphate dehydrogenase